MDDPNQINDQNKQKIMKSHIFDDKNDPPRPKTPPKTPETVYKNQYAPSPRQTQHNYTPTQMKRPQISSGSSYGHSNSFIQQIDPIPPTPPLQNIAPFPEFKFEPCRIAGKPNIVQNQINEYPNSNLYNPELVNSLSQLRERMARESSDFAEKMKNLIIYEQQPPNIFTKSMNMSGTLNGSQKLTIDGEFIMPNGVPFT